jgi:phytoene desaturase
MKGSVSGKRIVVVGAGIAGIAVSIRLAVKGFQVEVYEANEYLGGKLTAFEQDGFRFDAGPSMFTMPHLVDELFELAGKDAKSSFQYSRLEEACRYFYQDGTQMTAFSDPMRFGKEVQEKLGVDAGIVERHLSNSARIFELTRGIFLERSLHKLGSYFKKDVLKALFNLRSLQLLSTMDAANRKRLRHPKLVQLFNRYATYNGSSPYKAPAVLNLIPHLEHGIGAAMPKEGMHAISQSLAVLAKDLGVKFQLASPVERILVKDGKAVGVQVHGQHIPADLVVCNMDILPAYRKLLAGQKAPERILTQERSSSAMIFYWGIRRSFSQLGLHNIFFSADYAAEFAQIFDHAGIHHDPTVYVNISSKACPADAPNGMENWFVMINVPCDTGQDWQALREFARKNILSKLTKDLGEDIAGQNRMRICVGSHPELPPKPPPLVVRCMEQAAITA